MLRRRAVPAERGYRRIAANKLALAAANLVSSPAPAYFFCPLT
jgi:hypothetical protein